MNEQFAIQTAVGLIAPEEKYTSNAYWDVNGYAIGYGFHYYQDGSAVQPGDTMSKAVADNYIVTVATQKWKAIKPCLTVPINENQAAALISLAYNCGEGLVCKSNLLELINEQAPADQITSQFEKTCVTAGGTYLSSLYHRRVDEVAVFWSGMQQFVQENTWQILIAGAIVTGLLAYLTYRAVRNEK